MSADALPHLQDLIARAAGGDHGCFAQLYDRTHRHLFGIAVQLLGHTQAAEDALQEAYVSIWKNAGSYRPQVDGQPIQPMTWLIAIVRNKALDALRSRKRRQAVEVAQQAGTPSADDDDTFGPHAPDAAPAALQLFEQATRALRIEGCMAALDGSHRQSLALAYYQGLSHAEVAAQVDAPLGTVKAWIRRGLDKLRACLSEQGETP